MVQALLLGFLDRCNTGHEYNELATLMGIDQSNWICRCGNDNYWFREVCNRNNCQAQKPESFLPRGINVNAPRDARSVFVRGRGRGVPQGGRGFADVSAGRGEDWQCPNCG